MWLEMGRSTDVTTKSPSPYSNVRSPTIVCLAPCTTMPSPGSLMPCAVLVGIVETMTRTPASGVSGAPGRA
jgi:hypothetical protein